MTDFLHYQLKMAEKREAFANYSHASVSLTNAGIMERLAELKSQHEPLYTLSEGDKSLREKLYKAAFYVVVGRMPS